MEYKPKSTDAKRATVQELKKMMDEYTVVGIVNVENLPAKQLQNMRETLRDTVKILMAKKRLIKIALNESKKPGLKELESKMRGMPAVLVTKENPFKLFKILKQNKSKAPIKEGQIAPNDIEVPAGPTPFAPGPIIGELGSFKIKTGVEGGKVAIKEDAIVANEGEEVSKTLAALLTRLGIEPMEIGLDLVGVYENGEILDKSILDIDEETFIKDLQGAAAQAFNLAFNSGYPTKETVKVMLSKAHQNARNLAISQDIPADGVMGDLLTKAHNQAVILSGGSPAPATPSDNDDSKPEESKQDAPKEEPKEEPTAGLGALFG